MVSYMVTSLLILLQSCKIVQSRPEKKIPNKFGENDRRVQNAGNEEDVNLSSFSKNEIFCYLLTSIIFENWRFSDNCFSQVTYFPI